MTTPRCELGLALQTDKGTGEYAALARGADEAGFDVVTVFNDLWFQPALPALLEIAGATAHARVGPSCLNPFTLHPVEIAGQIAALDRVSDGRAFVGLAAGALARVARRRRVPAGDGRARGVGGDPPAARGRPRGLRRRALLAPPGRRLALRAPPERGPAARRHVVAPTRRVRRRRRRPRSRSAAAPIPSSSTSCGAGSGTTTSGSSSAP